ncbi:cAMP-binding domain of CRP or a regulatory subunit of cAMP-dependent protein kinases [Bosea sp. TND4EK4]|nr:cAMP-binding domain of CRP or a regulatory subunit of cAMP-dependent protein kinases [Bosea sp. TND4EK4]
MSRSTLTESCLLVDGIAARETVSREGKRQLSALHFAGDFVDLHGFVLKEIDHGVTALTDCTAVFVPHTEITRVIGQSPALGRALWMLTAVDAAIQRAWIACLGRSPALTHLAHLLCEIYLRLHLVDLAWGYRFSLAITQVELADALGLSPVHMNRTIQELRATGLVSWNGFDVAIQSWDGLLALAEFDGTYLNLVQRFR